MSNRSDYRRRAAVSSLASSLSGRGSGANFQGKHRQLGSSRVSGPGARLGGTANRAGPTAAAPTGELHIPRRGIFYASELLHHRDAKEYDKDHGGIERVCIIRFPPEVAAILRKRLAAQIAHEQTKLELLTAQGSYLPGGSGSIVDGAGTDARLGLTIAPTPKEDYRLFDITFLPDLNNPDAVLKMTGLLVELPTLIEAWKSLEGELLFKSNDISQMIYVFHPMMAPGRISAALKNPSHQRYKLQDRPVPATPETEVDEALLSLVRRVRDKGLWEWHAGLTPATHRIRSRKFRNFRMFDRADVAAAEREICDILAQKPVMEEALLEVVSEYEVEQQISQLCANSPDNSGSVGAVLDPQRPSVVAIIGPENPVLKAVLSGLSPASTIRMGHCENLGTELIRNVSDRKSEISLSLEQKLTYCTDPARQSVSPDEPIRDDLSDILFGEAGEDIYFEQEDPLAEEAARLAELSALDRGMESQHSDLSDDGGVSRIKRKKKKQSNQRQSQLPPQPQMQPPPQPSETTQ